MTDYRPIASPVVPNLSFEVHKGLVVDFMYSHVVRFVLYWTMAISLDLAFNVELVLRFASNSCKVHVKAVNRILCYLQATIAMSLVFRGTSDQWLLGYANANYLGYTTTRRSKSRYVFSYDQATLEWRSKIERVCGTLDHWGQTHLLVHDHRRGCMATRSPRVFESCATLIDCNIPIQLINNCLSGNWPNLSQNQSYKSLFLLYQGKIAVGKEWLKYCPSDNMIAYG